MPASSSESQPLHVRGGVFRRRNSLAWRILLPVPLTLLAVVGVIWWTLPALMESKAAHDAFISNQQVAQQFKTFRSYYSEFVVNKLVPSGLAKASHDHKGVPGTIPFPATLMLDLSTMLADSDTSIGMYSKYPFAGRKDRKLDEFQAQAWEFLVANPKQTFSREVKINGKYVVRTAVADTMSAQSCVNCHNSDPNSPKKDWKLGDVRGVIEVASVIDEQIAHGIGVSHLIVISALLAGLILSALTYWAIHGVTRPLGKLVAAMQSLAAGSFDVVLPGLHRKDEVGAMAMAVERFKVKAMEHARRKAEEDEALQRTAADERRASMRRLADELRGRGRQHRRRRFAGVQGAGVRGQHHEEHRRHHQAVCRRRRARVGPGFDQRQFGGVGGRRTRQFGVGDQPQGARVRARSPATPCARRKRPTPASPRCRMRRRASATSSS